MLFRGALCDLCLVSVDEHQTIAIIMTYHTQIQFAQLGYGHAASGQVWLWPVVGWFVNGHGSKDSFGCDYWSDGLAAATDQEPLDWLYGQW